MATMSRGMKVRLGIFVGTGIALLLGAFVLLAGRAMIEKRDEYRIRYSEKGTSFSGLEVGSDVKYSGIKIGRVERLAVAKDNVSVIEVTISIDSGTPIAEDSTASLESQGITGMKFIDISRGSEQARVRQPGEIIPAGQSLFDELTERATSVAAKLEEILVNLKSMTDPATQASFHQILESAAGLLTDNRATVAATLTDARSVVNRADALMADLTKAGGQVQAVMAPNGGVTVAITQTAELIERLNMLILRTEGDLGVTMTNLRETSANLSDFSASIKDNPSILINSKTPTDDVGR